MSASLSSVLRSLRAACPRSTFIADGRNAIDCVVAASDWDAYRNGSNPGWAEVAQHDTAPRGPCETRLERERAPRGRPPRAGAPARRVVVRLDAAESARLDALCAETGTDAATVLRRALS